MARPRSRRSAEQRYELAPFQVIELHQTPPARDDGRISNCKRSVSRYPTRAVAKIAINIRSAPLDYCARGYACNVAITNLHAPHRMSAADAPGSRSSTLFCAAAYQHFDARCLRLPMGSNNGGCRGELSPAVDFTVIVPVHPNGRPRWHCSRPCSRPSDRASQRWSD